MISKILLNNLTCNESLSIHIYVFKNQNFHVLRYYSLTIDNVRSDHQAIE